MSTLYNTTKHVSMNDISVTTGNADGWVLVLRDAIVSAGNGHHSDDARNGNGKRASKSSKNGARRPKR